jgi:hypothetical protein
MALNRLANINAEVSKLMNKSVRRTYGRRQKLTQTSLIRGSIEGYIHLAFGLVQCHLFLMQSDLAEIMV